MRTPRLDPRLACAVALASLFLSSAAQAGAPGWVDDAIADATCGAKTGPNDAALVLFAERTTSVAKNGDIRTRIRTVTRVLKAEGLQTYSHDQVASNDRVSVLELRGWRVDDVGKVHKTKKREAVELGTGIGAGTYSDVIASAIEVPDPRVGDVIAFESEWESRGDALEDSWAIGREVPVCLTRYALELPSGWTHHPTWVHTRAVEAKPASRALVWEVRNLAAVPIEASMPPWLSLAPWMRVRFAGGADAAVAVRSTRIENWDALGRWYAEATAPSLRESVTVRETARKMWGESVAASPLDGIATLAAFAQREIRYVAIELGTGSYIPRHARDVLVNRYGDCKDKATLLTALLAANGIEARYVVIHSQRGVTIRDVPTMRSFDHVILAIRLPDGASADSLAAAATHPRLGKILYFDPTDERTPFGRLPPELEGGLGLLVGADGSDLVTLPVSPPETNFVRRVVHATLDENGSLSGEIRDERTGAPARELRMKMHAMSEPERQSLMKQSILAAMPGAAVSDFVAENLRDISKPLVVRYRFTSPRYAALNGKIVTVRRSLFEDGALADSLFAKERMHAIQMSWIGRVENDVELTLPGGFRIAEVPAPVALESPFAKFECRTDSAGQSLHTIDTATFREREIRAADLATTRVYFRKVRESERAQAVLERVP